jgi:nucleoside-diphosphate kinase
LEDAVLERLASFVHVFARQKVVVADWQVFVHYWDMVVDADWYDLDVISSLRSMYVGQTVTVALANGPVGTPELLRDQLGHFDPTRAAEGTIRGDLGADSLATARAAGRLVENLVHTSDDAQATRRDFGTWYGARRHDLLIPRTASLPPARDPRSSGS